MADFVEMMRQRFVLAFDPSKQSKSCQGMAVVMKTVVFAILDSVGMCCVGESWGQENWYQELPAPTPLNKKNSSFERSYPVVLPVIIFVFVHWRVESESASCMSCTWVPFAMRNGLRRCTWSGETEVRCLVIPGIFLVEVVGRARHGSSVRVEIVLLFGAYRACDCALWNLWIGSNVRGNLGQLELMGTDGVLVRIKRDKLPLAAELVPHQIQPPGEHGGACQENKDLEASQG